MAYKEIESITIESTEQAVAFVERVREEAARRIDEAKANADQRVADMRELVESERRAHAAETKQLEDELAKHRG